MYVLGMMKLALLASLSPAMLISDPDTAEVDLLTVLSMIRITGKVLLS